MKGKMKQFAVEHLPTGAEVPMWARNLDEALEAAELEYGGAAVGRIRPVMVKTDWVTQTKETHVCTCAKAVTVRCLMASCT